MYFVYSRQNNSGSYYIGKTKDIDRRLSEHLNGQCAHTADLGPWKIVFYIRFSDITKAHSFELYLKTGSGRAFIKKHF